MAGYEPVPMLSIDTVGRDLTTQADRSADRRRVARVSKPTCARIVKTLGPNRPLILVGRSEGRDRGCAALTRRGSIGR